MSQTSDWLMGLPAAPHSNKRNTLKLVVQALKRILIHSPCCFQEHKHQKPVCNYNMRRAHSPVPYTICMRAMALAATGQAAEQTGHLTSSAPLEGHAGS